MHLLIIDHDQPLRARIHQIVQRLDGVTAVREFDGLDALPAGTKGAQAPVVLILSGSLSRGDVQDLLRRAPGLLVVIIGGNDAERMRAAFGEGARAFVRKTELASELPDALGIVAQGGIYVPPVIGMRAGGEPLMTTAGPVPAGFFREDGAQQLTPRQRQILSMIRDGRNNAEIAEALDLTVGTVKIHITAIFKALGVRNRTQAIIAAEWLDLPKQELTGS